MCICSKFSLKCDEECHKNTEIVYFIANNKLYISNRESWQACVAFV